MRKFSDNRRSFFARCFRTQLEPKATRPALGQRSAALTGKGIWYEPPHLLQFEVIEQRLGIEGCTLTIGGSYQIHPCEDATDVVLITNYQAYLRPRFLWRPLEALLVGQLHNHILDGVRGAIPLTNRGVLPAVAESLTPQCAPPGGLACTVSQSCSRR